MSGEVDYSRHRGSCRIFYAERRCTCGADSAPDNAGLRDQRHAAATAWCQDDTTMPEVEAFGAGWDAAVAGAAVTVPDNAGLREAIRDRLIEQYGEHPVRDRDAWFRDANYLLALPELAALLAERDTFARQVSVLRRRVQDLTTERDDLAAKVAAVRELAGDDRIRWSMTSDDLRRALGDPS